MHTNQTNRHQRNRQQTVVQQTVVQHTVVQHTVALRGQILFADDDASGAYEVLAGEVLIMRNGRAVDLIEAREWLDLQIWPDATTVAWTDCVLRDVVPLGQSSPVPDTREPVYRTREISAIGRSC